MNPISALVDILAKLAKMGRVVANIGPSQLIKQLNALRSNLEQFKEAIREDDVSKMQQLLAECEAESDLLEKRLFKGLDDRTNKSLSSTIRRARASKKAITKKRQQTPSPQKIRTALKAKRAELASTIATRDETHRQELVEEIDKAIGKLRGISKSLESFKL
ncbi:hypothetical protein [Bradyrhizobium sp. AZCC 1578]|uniref:hypothetical protein n=1 Tax=Bradyrhizobium sp. AZCC 1578 TaxID=3117027 RepID=UPI002FF05354